jgi:hypothetical protein
MAAVIERKSPCQSNQDRPLQEVRSPATLRAELLVPSVVLVGWGAIGVRAEAIRDRRA